MALVAEPKHIYTVTVFNLPEPDYGDYRVKKQISIPGKIASHCHSNYIKNMFYHLITCITIESKILKYIIC